VSYIVRFRADGSDDHGLVGGKAASLGRLARAEFPVPPGFTVSTRAHESFLQAGRLNEQIAEILGSIDFGDATAIDTQTARIRALITDSPMPDEVVAAIAADYRALGDDPYVAVRSSGTAEDLADASFAGMHDTYLDVRGEQDVLDAVRRCWASMWTARATAYRHNGKHDQEAARLAVVVQTMVESDVSGVMFTANPMTARTDEIVVNASWGLGEGIVSGVLTPDEYLLAKGNLKIKARTVGAKEKQVRRNPETSRGTVLVDTPQQDRDRSSLSDEHLVELADLGRRVMDFYGGLPQDIEWALVGEQLHLLQSRPVTGAEFTWDEEVDGWYDVPEDEDTIWTFHLGRAVPDRWHHAAVLLLPRMGMCRQLVALRQAVRLRRDHERALVQVPARHRVLQLRGGEDLAEGPVALAVARSDQHPAGLAGGVRQGTDQRRAGVEGHRPGRADGPEVRRPQVGRHGLRVDRQQGRAGERSEPR
jgi:hypothetical protein